MTDQEQKISETKASTSEQSVEKPNENELNSSEQRSTRRSNVSEDIRYSTEQNDREKLLEKYDNYQVSSTNACNVRFLADHRQKQLLFGHPEGKSKHNRDLFFFKYYFRGKFKLAKIDQNIPCEHVRKY